MFRDHPGSTPHVFAKRPRPVGLTEEEKGKRKRALQSQRNKKSYERKKAKIREERESSTGQSMGSSVDLTILLGRYSLGKIIMGEPIVWLETQVMFLGPAP